MTIEVGSYVYDPEYDNVGIATMVLPADECAVVVYHGDPVAHERYFMNLIPLVAIGRPIEGVSLNGLEYALDDSGDVYAFTGVDSAKKFLTDNGVAEDDLDEFAFVSITVERFGEGTAVKLIIKE